MPKKWERASILRQELITEIQAFATCSLEHLRRHEVPISKTNNYRVGS